MPKRNDISSILIIGAGPIVIGQACEFDYSGTQACKTLKAEGYKIILINSNPATIMTDPDVADRTYIEPITKEFITKIIELERPDCILATLGGQTALNCALELAKDGVLEKYNVELIGANVASIEKAENRLLFKQAMQKIGLDCPKNIIVESVAEAMVALKEIGLPAIIRPSFTLGGSGGGIAYNEEQFLEIVEHGLSLSANSQLLIDESVIGWKEYEMEVIRDKDDNCIIVCAIENVDPMGVHTGDSITVAPTLTLTDKEYQIMRNAAIAVLREIGVATGGSNVQFAINPKNGKMLVIEMNPRVSRSSALASKATGFPIASVAAKLAIGYNLAEIMNDCTKTTPASFEPVMDYIIVKIPRFAFEKFALTKAELSSSMKSVGEIMAIGRSFAESLQKALRSLENGLTGLDNIQNFSQVEIKQALAIFCPERLLLIADAFRCGLSLKEIYEITNFDPWFLEQIKLIIDSENILLKANFPISKTHLFSLKKQGFSDQKIAQLLRVNSTEIQKLRHSYGLRPVYKRIDTCAGEFASNPCYMYSCYEGDGENQAECEAQVSDANKIIILGSGPNRIGQGVEFDYACVHASYALKEAGFETIMINCNPETVSTDYDSSDRLYFEPITSEDVLEIINVEIKSGKLIGVVLQFGGQTPLKLAKILQENNIPILGTTPDSIDLAEDRQRFKQLIEKLNLKQTQSFACYDEADVFAKVKLLALPIVVRPSYVLGGRAMEIIYDNESLVSYLKENKNCFNSGPLLLDSFLTDATEVDVDAICDGEEVFIAGIMEHIEEAGIHSGDSSCSLPPFSLSTDIIASLTIQTKALAIVMKVIGLVNIQYAIKNNIIYVLEVNPRSSRTVPFIAKAINLPIAKIAAHIMVGKKLVDFGLKNKNYIDFTKNHVSVKEPVFPFVKFPDVDTILGPEMKSTGEAMGIDKDFVTAFAKAKIASNMIIPSSGTVFISVKNSDKPEIYNLALELIKLDFKLIATVGTYNYLTNKGLKLTKVNKVQEGQPHVVDLLKENSIKLVINTTEGKQAIKDSLSIRRTALLNKIPCLTNLSSAKALIQSIKRIKQTKEFEVRCLQSFF